MYLLVGGKLSSFAPPLFADDEDDITAAEGRENSEVDIINKWRSNERKKNQSNELYLSLFHCLLCLFWTDNQIYQGDIGVCLKRHFFLHLEKIQKLQQAYTSTKKCGSNQTLVCD